MQCSASLEVCAAQTSKEEEATLGGPCGVLDLRALVAVAPRGDPEVLVKRAEADRRQPAAPARPWREGAEEGVCEQAGHHPLRQLDRTDVLLAEQWQPTLDQARQLSHQPSHRRQRCAEELSGLCLRQ